MDGGGRGKVSRFQSFKVSEFQGFGVSRSGVWSRRSTDQDGSARILGVSELRGWLMIVFGDGGGDVSHEVVMDFLGIGAVDEDADAAGGDVDGVDAEDFTAADRDVKAEPVGAKQPAGAVEGDRRGDGAIVVVAGAGEDTLAEFVGPGGASDQRLVEEVAKR